MWFVKPNSSPIYIYNCVNGAQNGLHSIHINHFFCFALGFFGLVFFLRTSSSHSMLNQIKKWLTFSDKHWIVRLRVSGVARSHKPISCQQQITFDDHTHARVNHKLILTHIPFFTVDDLRNGHPVFARLHPDGLDNLYLVARHHEPARREFAPSKTKWSSTERLQTAPCQVQQKTQTGQQIRH